MSKYLNETEPKISRDGVIGTTIFHALLLLFFVFMGMTAAWTPPEEEGVLINFGTADYGWGEVQPHTNPEPAVAEAQPAEAEPEESTPPPAEPAKQIPKPVVDNKVVTTDDPEAPALPEKERVKKADPKKTETKKPTKKETKPTPKPKPKPKPTPKPKKDTPKKDDSKSTQTTPTPPKKEEPKIDENALFKGGKTSSTSQGNTPGKSGDMGSNMGDVDISTNKGNESHGPGKDGVGYSLSGRKLLGINVNDNSQEVGTVVVRIKVNRQGQVIDAQYMSAGSTTTSTALRSKAIAAAKKAKFNAEPNAQQIQQGTITFRFKVQ